MEQKSETSTGLAIFGTRVNVTVIEMCESTIVPTPLRFLTVKNNRNSISSDAKLTLNLYKPTSLLYESVHNKTAVL